VVTRPPTITSELDIRDSAQRAAWEDQIRSEIKETVDLTRVTITQSRTLLAEIDRVLARR